MDLLVECGHSLSGFDLVQPKGEGKPAGKLLNAADMGGGAVQVGTLVLDQLIEQLRNRQHCRFRLDAQSSM